MPDWQSALNHAPGPADVWPLVAAAGERAFAWRDGAPISVDDFLRDVQHVAAELPPISRALNACNDRYLFAVALGACLARDIVTLVPPARTQGVLAQLRGDAADLVLLVDPDDREPDGGLPMHRIELGTRTAATPSLPALPGTQLVARVYTSGSTGQPQAQPKYWGPLVRGAAAQLQRLAAVAPPNIALVGTVPPQHAYGFESTVMSSSR